MSDLAIIAAEPSTLDQYADAGEFVVQACTRAKEWLEQAIEHGEIEQVINVKSQAEAIRVYTVQKQLGKDAELAAAEIVRRAERGLGLCVRRGQEAGEFRRRGETTQWRPVHDVDKRTPAHVFANHAEMTDSYSVVDDVPDEMFDAAIVEAKDDGNLSRSNVVRTVGRMKVLGIESTEGRVKLARRMAAEGSTTGQIAEALQMGREGTRNFCRRHDIDVPADRVVGRRRLLDSNRLVDGTVLALAGIGSGLELVDFEALDGNQLSGWVISLSDAIRSLTTLRNNLKKEITNRDPE